MPIPLSMVTEVALVEVHVSVEDPPDAIDAGVAVNVIVGEPTDAVTVIVAELFALALALLAVAV